MNTFSIAVKTILPALALALMTSCGNGDGADNGADSSKNVSGTKQGEAYTTSINIRYVDMDSLMKHYDYAIEQQAVLQQIEMELQQYQNQLGRNLQSKEAAIQQKVQSNSYLSEASYKADLEELQRLNQASQNEYARRAQADSQRVYDINKAVNDAIQEYVIEYNKTHKYDAILHKEVGLYFNPALDITGELVDGLNKAYAAKKAETKKDEAAKTAEKK